MGARFDEFMRWVLKHPRVVEAESDQEEPAVENVSQQPASPARDHFADEIKAFGGGKVFASYLEGKKNEETDQ